MRRKNIDAPDSEEKTLGVIAHLAPLAGHIVVVGNIIIPLVILLLKGDESKYIEFHAKESLNFQISMTIYWAITIALYFLLLGCIITIPLVIFQVVVMIIGALKAGNGEYFWYPLCIRFIR